jgi:hypothetical protein
MILNDKPNCQVSRILMNPSPILSDSSENDPYSPYMCIVHIEISRSLLSIVQGNTKQIFC